MSDKKLTKGTYYSCSHQQLSNSKCNTCKAEQERERERESNLKQEHKQKTDKYKQLAERRNHENDTDAIDREMNSLESWSRDNLTHEEWSGGSISSNLDKDPVITNTSPNGCKECSRYLLFETKTTRGATDKYYKKVDYQKLNLETITTEYKLMVDCYHKGGDNLVCVNHQGKKDNPQQDQAVVSAILAYFQKHSIKSIKLENNKLIIKFSNKTEKQEEVNNTELQQIQSYIQNHSQNNELTLEELEQIKSNTEKPFNWTPWIIGGSIVIGLILLAIIISSRKRKKA